MTPASREGLDMLVGSAVDAQALLVAAETDWTRPIAHCPAWDAAGLTRHMGTIFWWMAGTVLTGQRANRSELGPIPEDPADLPPWYLAGLNLVLDTLGSADPERDMWTFSAADGEHKVKWWWRRLPVEVAVHRWDAQYALSLAGGPPADPLDGNVAGAGIGEFLIDFLPPLLAVDGLEDMAGTLHLHATDGPVEWLVDLGAGGVAVPEHAKADTAIRGTRSDLLLWLHNRTPAAPLEIFGDTSVLDYWHLLER
jgi:hypothetical protein